MKKILSLLLVLALFLSLAGCAGRDGAADPAKTGAQSEEYTTVTTASPLLSLSAEGDGGLYRSINSLTSGGDAVYYVLRESDGESWTEGDRTLYRLPQNGGEPESLGRLSPDLDPYLGAAGPDGSLWFYGDGPALTHLDPDGSPLARYDLSGLPLGDVSWLHAILLDGEGRVYLWFGGIDGVTLTALDLSESPGLRFSLELKYLSDMPLVFFARCRDGRLAALRQTEKGSRLSLIDGDSGTVAREIELEGVNYGQIFNGAGECDLFLRAGNKLFGYRLESGALTEELDIGMAGILFSAETQILPLSDGSFAVQEGWEPSILRVVKERIPADSGVVLRLALTGDEYSPGRIIMEAAVRRWNRENAAVKIEILDYSVYSTSADPDAGSLRLMTELITGSQPDLYELSGMPASFLAKDRFADLYPYLDADGEIRREDLYEKLLSASEIGGELRQITPFFSLASAAANGSFVSDRQGLSPADYEQILQHSPGLEDLFSQTLSKRDLLRILTCANLSSLVDWDSGQCAFDGELFREILRMASRLPAEPSADYSVAQSLASGRLLLQFCYVSLSQDDAQYLLDRLGEDFRFPGLPCLEGSGTAARPLLSLAMSAGSEHKDACWQFMRAFLLEGAESFGYFSLRRGNSQALLEQVLTASPNVDGRQEAKAYSPETVKAALDKILALAESADRLYTEDENLLSLVQEIAAAYFAGDRSLDDTVKDIQARARIYVAEQMG